MMKSGLRRREGGFTLIELMIVIAIIGILAAIAIPQFSAYRARGYNAAALSDARNCYTAAQAYFATWLGGSITDIEVLKGDYAFVPSDAMVDTVILDGGQDTLRIRSTPIAGTKVYTIDQDGRISETD